MQGSKSAFFTKSEKRNSYEDGFKRSHNSKQFVDRNKIERRAANRQEKSTRT